MGADSHGGIRATHRTMFVPVNVPVNDDGITRGYISTTNTIFKPINVPVKKMRVSHVATLVPRTKFKPINIPVDNDGNIHGYVPCTQCSNLSIYQSNTTVSHVARYVSTTEKPTRIKNTSKMDRSTKDHTCHMYEVHNMIPISICQKGSH